MAENSPLDVLAWIRRLGPDFKDSIAPYGLSCVFPYNKIREDEPLFRATTNYWFPTQHVFRFNGVELCPTIKEFGAIMSEPAIDNLVFPTMGGDLPSLVKVMLGVPLAMPNRWCVFSKLNLSLVFVHFPNLAIPVDERPHSFFLRVFCLCALARYFLVQRSYCVDLQMCMVVYELKRGNPVGLILVETLNSLDAFHRKEASFLVGNTLLLQV